MTLLDVASPVVSTGMYLLPVVIVAVVVVLGIVLWKRIKK